MAKGDGKAVRLAVKQANKENDEKKKILADMDQQQKRERDEAEKKAYQAREEQLAKAVDDARTKFQQAAEGPEKEAASKELDAAWKEFDEHMKNKPASMKSGAEKMMDSMNAAAAGGNGGALGGVGGASMNMANMALQNAQKGAGDPTGVSEALREQEDTYLNEGRVNEQAAAQRDAQEANRNYMDVAAQESAAMNEARNTAMAQETTDQLASAVALKKTFDIKDPSGEKARQDNLAERSAEHKEKAMEMKEEATNARSMADSRDNYAMNNSVANATSDALSNPPGEDDSASVGADNDTGGAEPAAEEGGAEEAGDEPAAEEEQAQEEQAQEEPAAEPAAEQPQEEEKLPPGDPQKVINELTGANDPKNRVQTPDDKALLQWVMKKFGVSRIERSDAAKADPKLAENEFIQKFPEKGQDAMTALRTGRAGGDASKASQNYVNDKAEGSGEAMSHQMTTGTGSDMRIKNIAHTLKQFKYF